MTEYYNIFDSMLKGATIETIANMTEPVPSASPTPNINDIMVDNPNGYGYIAPIHEMRKNDAIDIQSQQSSIFALGAITGVSLIVFGILITSYSNSK
jgi:hypothetical protein